MTLKTFFLTSLMTASIGAQAFQATPAKPDTIKYPTPPAEWILKENEPVRIKLIDGREMTLKRSILKPEWITIPFTIYENTCKPQKVGQKGGHHLLLLFVKVAPIWSTHPDPAKIGQVVKKKSGFDGTFNALETSDFMAPSNFRRMGELRGLIEAEEIRMQDFSWIPEHEQSTAPESVHVTRWEGELNLGNAETGAAENRPLQGYAGVDLVKKTDQSLMVLRIQSLLSLFGRNAYPFGDVTTFSISNSKKELCQIATKIDQAPLIRDARRIQGERQKLEEPLIYGVDSLLALWAEYGAFQLSQISPENLFSASQETRNGITTDYFTLQDLQ
ncbi:MAG: hypothetical protein K2X47_18790 [Bdellovibrionales bacterium]|nr:hypothetical protein [Bdellovibrionales bacterium]